MAAKKQAKAPSKDEQVGFHKGSISVLAKEREELSRILGIVEQLMQMHVSALKELGVDLEQEAKDLAQVPQGKGLGKPRNKPPIEDVI